MELYEVLIYYVALQSFIIMSSTSATGYGPSSRLYFDGEESRYELWEAKFLGYMRRQKLLDIINPSDEEAAVDQAKNADAYAELIQYLDDRSLGLVMRDNTNDGKNALKTLRSHYLGKGKPRILSLYKELTSLIKGSNECVTDYLIRGETAAASLKSAGETISDSLLIAMVLKGLPSSYGTFSTIITQREGTMSFSDFKASLRSQEESDKCRQQGPTGSENVMGCQTRDSRFSRQNGATNMTKGTSYGGQTENSLTCYSCGKPGHRSSECRSRKSRWCHHCKSKTHDTRVCRKNKDSHTAKTTKTYEEEDYLFKVTSDFPKVARENTLLVDCGATTHILNDKSKFVNLDENFDPANHVIELADGSRTSGLVLAKGSAEIVLHDQNGDMKNVTLSNALFVPSYDQNIFSVQAATEKGACVNFAPNSAELCAPDGTKFAIEKHGRLYFLNNTVASTGAHSAEEWHKILGHCNMKDVLKLENIVDGMKVTTKPDNFSCEICIEGKMTQYISRNPDRRATQPLEFVHSDLSGPISPVALDGYKYAMCFVDDCSGAIFVYFLKNKSDATQATEKFLADVAPYGDVKRLRSDRGGEYINEEFNMLMSKNKIKHETSAPNSPHQNGTAERSWRSLFDMARCLLLDSKLPKLLLT